MPRHSIHLPLRMRSAQLLQCNCVRFCGVRPGWPAEGSRTRVDQQRHPCPLPPHYVSSTYSSRMKQSTPSSGLACTGGAVQVQVLAARLSTTSAVPIPLPETVLSCRIAPHFLHSNAAGDGDGRCVDPNPGHGLHGGSGDWGHHHHARQLLDQVLAGRDVYHVCNMLEQSCLWSTYSERVYGPLCDAYLVRFLPERPGGLPGFEYLNF